MYVGLKLTIPIKWNVGVIRCWVRGYELVFSLGWLLSKLRVCSASLNTSRFVLPAVQTPTKLETSNSVVVSTFVHNPNLFPHWKDIQKQLLFQSSSRIVPWLTQNNIPTSSAHCSHLNQLQNPLNGFDFTLYRVSPGLPQNQPSLWDIKKNSTIHINPIETAVNNIITTILSKER